jgi:hypothetical protein
VRDRTRLRTGGSDRIGLRHTPKTVLVPQERVLDVRDMLVSESSSIMSEQYVQVSLILITLLAQLDVLFICQKTNTVATASGVRPMHGEFA